MSTRRNILSGGALVAAGGFAMRRPMSGQILQPTEPFGSVSAASGGNTTVFLGDSITAFGNALQTGADNSFSWGWTGQTVFLSLGRVQQLYNAGVPGNTTAQMLARFTADVLAYKPQKVVIMGGTNDLPNTTYASATLQATLTNLLSMVTLARQNGILPILCTIPPRGDAAIYTTNAQILAQGIRRIAATNSIPLIDMYSLLVDLTSGAYQTAYDKGDHIHPSAAACTVMANAFVAKIVPQYYGPAQIYQPYSNAETFNLVSNPLFGSGSVGSTITGWSAGFGTSPAPTVTKVAGDANITGAYLNASFPVATGSSQNYSFNNNNIALTGGHKYALSFHIQTSGIVANGATFNIVQGYSGNALCYGYNVDIANGLFYAEFLPAASNANFGVVLYPTTTASGNIVIKLGQVGLIDLTALGF